MKYENHKNGADYTAPIVAKVIYAMAWTGGVLSSLLILIALGFTLVSVFWRYILEDPLLWPEDLTGWTLVGLIMLGTSEAYRRGDHISIDLLSNYLSPRQKKLQSTWSHCVVFVFAFVVGLSSWEAISFAYDFGAYTSGSVEVPSWIPKIPMLIGATLMGLTAIAKIIETSNSGTLK